MCRFYMQADYSVENLLSGIWKVFIFQTPHFSRTSQFNAWTENIALDLVVVSYIETVMLDIQSIITTQSPIGVHVRLRIIIPCQN